MFSHILPHEAMHNHGLWHGATSIHLPGCLSHLGVVWKRLNIPSTFSPSGIPTNCVLADKEVIMVKFCRGLSYQGHRMQWGIKNCDFQPTTISLYLRNDTRQSHSHCRMPIGTRKQCTEWCHFQWPWATPKPDFKDKQLFDIQYIRNNTSNTVQRECCRIVRFNVTLDTLYVIFETHHSLNGSSGSVNGDLQFLWDRQISTPYKINTPEPINKKFGTVDYVREGNPCNKFYTNSPTAGLLGKWVKYNKKFYLYLFFSGTHTGQTHWWIFTRDSSKDVKSCKDVPFWGYKT